MGKKLEGGLNHRRLNAGRVEQLHYGGWQLSLPPGMEGEYRLAQLDDYLQSPHRHFSFQPPFFLGLRAKISHTSIPGTWGFGFWNDPFVMGLGLPGSCFRLPALPNAAWFFHASDENYLSFRDDLPANGMLAAVFSAPLIPSIFSLAALPFAPLLFLTPTARMLRRWATSIVKEDSSQIELDWTTWHQFELEAELHRILFRVDGDVCMETKIIPRGRLGFVCWIDNQFLALDPDEKFRFGALQSDTTICLEITDLIFRKEQPGS